MSKIIIYNQSDLSDKDAIEMISVMLPIDKKRKNYSILGSYQGISTFKPEMNCYVAPKHTVKYIKNSKSITLLVKTHNHTCKKLNINLNKNAGKDLRWT